MSEQITFDELMAEIDRLRPKKPIIQLTKEQRQLIIKGRQKGLTYSQIAAVWNKHQDWPQLSRRQLNEWGYKLGL